MGHQRGHCGDRRVAVVVGRARGGGASGRGHQHVDRAQFAGRRQRRQRRVTHDQDVRGADAEEAAQGEYSKPPVKNGLAPPAVGRHTERDLQEALRQSVDAKRHADQGEVVAAREMARMDREHWKNQEKAEHTQAKHAGEACAGAQFGGAHAIGGQRQDAAGKRDAL